MTRSSLGFDPELDGMEVKHPSKRRKAWEDASERRAFMDSIAVQHNVKEPKDWREVRAEDLVEAGGSRLLARYGNSMWQLLKGEYPEWAGGVQPWTCRKHLPKGFWKNKENRAAFLREVMEAHGIEKPEDWSRVSVKDMRERGGSGLLSTYGSSISRLVNATFPTAELPARKSNTDPTASGVRKRARNDTGDGTPRRRQRPRPCIPVTPMATSHTTIPTVHEEQPLEEGGTDSEGTAEETSNVLDEPDTLPTVKGWGFWKDPANQRRFMDMVKNTFAIREAKEWGSVGVADLERLGGGGLVKRMGSVAEIVQKVYSEEQFSALDLGKRLPVGWWDVRENRREFMERLAKENGVRNAGDWKRVTREYIVAAGGSRLLSKFSTVQKVLLDVFPEMEEELSKAWLCRKGDRSTRWDKEENVKKFFESVKGRCGVRESSDWARVSVQLLQRLGGGPLLRNYGGLVPALAVAYPDEDWSKQPSPEVKKSSQWALLTAMRKFFGSGTEVEEDAHPPELAAAAPASKPGQRLELDIYLPQHALAVEYNGQHHFEDVPFFGPVEAYRERDILKRQLCEECGIRLVIVPYWWDMQLESLAAFLYNEVPSIVDSLEPSDPEVRQLIDELREGKHAPIAEAPPTKNSSSRSTPGSVRGTVLSDGRDGHAFLSGTEDPTGMLVRERLDSIRVHWDGKGGALSYGHGKRLKAPAWWLDELPQGTECDGELWMGQGQLGTLIYRLFLEPGRELYFSGDYDSPGQPQERVDDELWRDIKFIATDCSEELGLGLQQRIRMLGESVEENKVFQLATYELCTGKEHLEGMLAKSERLVLQKASAAYSYHRKDSLRCQVRRMARDDVRVVAASPTVRGLIVEVPVGDGSASLQQSVRCSQAMYKCPPPPGSVVRVLHMGRWQSGRLKHPSVLH